MKFQFKTSLSKAEFQAIIGMIVRCVRMQPLNIKHYFMIETLLKVEKRTIYRVLKPKNNKLSLNATETYVLMHMLLDARDMYGPFEYQLCMRVMGEIHQCFTSLK